MLRWPLLWKRCHVSQVEGNRNNDKNVLVCFSYLPGCHPLLSDILICFSFLFFFAQFYFQGQNHSNFSILCNQLWYKKRGHKHHVSTLRWHYFLTFTAKLGPDSWSVWSYGVNWRKASDFGASTNDKQQYFQIFFSLAGQTQLALRSVKQTKTLQHWNVTWQQVWV